jgi:hypothetical protein
LLIVIIGSSGVIFVILVVFLIAGQRRKRLRFQEGDNVTKVPNPDAKTIPPASPYPLNPTNFTESPPYQDVKGHNTNGVSVGLNNLGVDSPTNNGSSNSSSVTWTTSFLTNQGAGYISIPGYLKYDLKMDFQICKQIGQGATATIHYAVINNMEIIKKHGIKEAALKVVSLMFLE